MVYPPSPRTPTILLASFPFPKLNTLMSFFGGIALRCGRTSESLGFPGRPHRRVSGRTSLRQLLCPRGKVLLDVNVYEVTRLSPESDAEVLAQS